jgi:hypothetical protein
MTDLERKNKQKREWSADNIEKFRAQKARYRETHKVEIAARAKVRRAINKGELPALNQVLCAGCKGEPKHYHHPCYALPLEVIPLCTTCHNLAHILEPKINEILLKWVEE